MPTPSDAVAASNARLVAAGGRRVSARLRPGPAAALSVLMTLWRCSANEAIERALTAAELSANLTPPSTNGD